MCSILIVLWSHLSVSIRFFNTSELLQSKNGTHGRYSQTNQTNPKKNCFAIWSSTHPVHSGCWRQGNERYSAAVTCCYKVCCVWRKHCYKNRTVVNLSGYTCLVSFYRASFFTGYIFISRWFIVVITLFFLVSWSVDSYCRIIGFSFSFHDFF